MAIKGSLKEASLADVLQLLALGRKSGCLTVTDRTNLGYVYFDSGQIAYASIVNRLDRLGDILLKSGRITTEQLQDGIGRQSRQREQRLGEILVSQGAISPDELGHFMRMQIEEAVYTLFTWNQGRSHSRPTSFPTSATTRCGSTPRACCSREHDGWTNGV